MNAHEISHAHMVVNLVKPGEEIVLNMTAKEAHILHTAVGISGEAGELLDAIKKHVMYKKPLDLSNVIEELGDLEFYMEGLRAAIGVGRDTILANNIAKLTKRYDKGSFSNEQAQERKDKA